MAAFKKGWRRIGKSKRWIAYQFIEGEYRIRQALMSGELVALGGNDTELPSTQPLGTVPG